MKNGRRFSGLAALFLILLWLPAGCRTVDPPPPEPALEEAPPPALLPVVHEDVFPRNSNLMSVLSEQGFTPTQVHELIDATRSAYDLNRVRAGNRYRVERWPDGRFHRFSYQIDNESFFEARAGEDGYLGEVIQIPFEVVVDEISGVIEESLWLTLKTIGETDELIVRLAEILQWDVDFTAIQSGDWFKLVVEKKFHEGEFVKYGEIEAVQFNSSGKDYYGFRFQAPGAKEARYYDESGNALRKAFLKVPFHFSPRISSGFSYSRFHPILKKRRPHLALDFAAPHGTPVLASASGRVIFAGWKGGYGNFVQIRHPNGYTTGYAHLSKIHVRAGASVKQAQVIGRVGKTGLATAAHLDYRVQDKRGRFINPRKKISWPSDKPVDPADWSAFAASKDAFLARLSEIEVQFGQPAAVSRTD